MGSFTMVKLLVLISALTISVLSIWGTFLGLINPSACVLFVYVCWVSIGICYGGVVADALESFFNVIGSFFSKIFSKKDSVK